MFIPAVQLIVARFVGISFLRSALEVAEDANEYIYTSPSRSILAVAWTPAINTDVEGAAGGESRGKKNCARVADDTHTYFVRACVLKFPLPYISKSDIPLKTKYLYNVADLLAVF